VPLVMGKFLDNGMKSMSFVVPTVCFAYLLLLSLKAAKRQPQPERTKNNDMNFNDDSRV